MYLFLVVQVYKEFPRTTVDQPNLVCSKFDKNLSQRIKQQHVQYVTRW